MQPQGLTVLYSLTLIHAAAAITFLRRNLTISDSAWLNGTTAWDTALAVAAGSSSAPHATNGECSARLGKYWSLPQSDIAVRHNLIPGATVIFEVGGNIGEDLAQYIWRFPAAKIFSFEPVPELYQVLTQKFGGNLNVKIQQVGVSNSDRATTFTVGGNHGEGSSHTNTTAYGQRITVQLRDAHALLTEVQTATGKVPDVVSINCEGCEYDVLSRMAHTGWLGKVPFVQLSWHIVGGVQDRLNQRCAIEKVLWDRYEPAYHALYGWQGWRLKTAAYFFLQEDDVVDSEDDVEEAVFADDEQEDGDSEADDEGFEDEADDEGSEDEADDEGSEDEQDVESTDDDDADA
jgi:FkbM family methyltransferase